MTARTTYEATVKTAGQTKITTLIADELTKQETINQSGCNVGYNLVNGNYANLAAAVKNANAAKRDADFAAEVARQATLMVQRDLLRDSGDKASV